MSFNGRKEPLDSAKSWLEVFTMESLEAGASKEEVTEIVNNTIERFEKREPVPSN